MLPHSNSNPLLQEPLPQLRDAGEPLLEVSMVAQRLQMSPDAVRELAENGKLLAFGRNAQAKKGSEKRVRYVFPARAITLYELYTANFTGQGVAEFLLVVARRLSRPLRLWLRNELSRSLESGE